MRYIIVLYGLGTFTTMCWWYSQCDDEVWVMGMACWTSISPFRINALWVIHGGWSCLAPPVSHCHCGCKVLGRSLNR